MDAFLFMMRWPVVLLASIPLAYWLIVNLRLLQYRWREVSIRAGLDVPLPEGTPPLVSVVVPAHNEEEAVAACAESLRAQDYPNIEVIFVLDRCTDRTRERLDPHVRADPRLSMIENQACPPDWAGKCNAARIGAEAARGEWLLFTDADTVFDPSLVRAAMGIARERQLDLLSLLSTLSAARSFERIVQPVAAITLMRIYPLDRVNRLDRPRPFANGQFMLFRRSMYEALSGHAAVKDDLLEDIAFARKVFLAGGRGGLVIADGMLRCTMYDSLAAFTEGWRRIFIEACKRKPDRLRRYGWLAITHATLFPAMQVLTLAFAAHSVWRGDVPWAAAATGIVLVGWMLQLIALARIYGLSHTPRWAALLYPAGSWVVGRIMMRGARDLEERRPVRWGGREYVLEPR